MNNECESKIKDMQKYVPFLGNLIETLNKDSSKAAKLSQMQLLYKLLTKPDTGVTIDMLTKCEEVLEKVFGNSEQPENLRSSTDENSTTIKQDHIDSETISDVKNKAEDTENIFTAISPPTVCNSDKCIKSDESESPDEGSCADIAKSNVSESTESTENLKTCSLQDDTATADDIAISTKNQDMENENTTTEGNTKSDDNTEGDENVVENKTDDLKKQEENAASDEIVQNEDEQKKEADGSDIEANDESCAQKKDFEKDKDNEAEQLKADITPDKNSCEDESPDTIEDKEEDCKESVKNDKKLSQENSLTPSNENNAIDEEEAIEKKQVKEEEEEEKEKVKEEEEEKVNEIKAEEKIITDKGIGEKDDKKTQQNNNEKTMDETREDKNLKDTKEVKKSTVVNDKSDEDVTSEILTPEDSNCIAEGKVNENNKQEENLSDTAPDEDLLVEMKGPPVESSEISVEENDKDNMKSQPPSNANKRLSEESATIKTIELKPKDPSEKAAVVYLVKKGAPKPMETINLLDSDSEDDDVIIVSESGLKKRPSVPKPIVQKKVVSTTKFPQPKASRANPPPAQNAKPMFAITSVKSIGQQRPIPPITPGRGMLKIISPHKGITIRQVKPQPVTPMQRTSITSQPMLHKTNVLPVSKSTTSPLQRSNSQTKLVTPSSKVTPTRNSRDSTLDRVSGSLDDSTSDSTSRHSGDGEASKSAQCQSRDDQKSIEWVQNFITNLLSPSQNVTQFGMELLQKSLDFQTYCRIKGVIEENKKAFAMMHLKDFSSEMGTKREDIKSLFIKDGALTELGTKLATSSRQSSNKVYTTDRQNGTTTSRSRKRPKELEDDEYEPSVIVEFAQETVADRRKSLRRESKTNRKQYFAYEDDDDTEFLEMLEEQARIEASSSAKKKRPTPRRSNGSTGNEVEVKKMRLEEGFSVDTPFETDLLTPTWVEEGPRDGMEFPEEEIEAVQQEHEREHEQEQEQEQEIEQEQDQETEQEQEEGDRPILGPGETFKNTNKAHHCRSRFIDACVLCNMKHNFVVAHYVNQHRDTEVVISRLTQRDTDQLVRNINCGYLVATKSTAYQYSATCVFCKREMTFALRYWWEHYTMHTGEYGYECSKCLLRRPRRQHAQKHANNDCKLGAAQVKIVYNFDKTTNNIEAYICKLCNYIQLHKENVVRHLKTQHDLKKDILSHIFAIVLLQISKPYQDGALMQDVNNSNYDLDNSNSGQCATGENSYQSYDPNEESQADFMQYSDVMMPSDDLSFMICGMLASDDAAQSTEQSSSQNETGTSSTEKQNSKTTNEGGSSQ